MLLVKMVLAMRVLATKELVKIAAALKMRGMVDK
jgi:hypothetical protein